MTVEIPAWVLISAPALLGTVSSFIVATRRTTDYDFGAAFIGVGLLVVGWTATLCMLIGRCSA